jgi:endonuclease YncB( thermonuclease family)
MKIFFWALFLSMLPTISLAQGKPNGDPERIENGKPDYHQYEGEIIEIKDADTVTVKIHLLPGLEYTVDVRSKGVDAPELHRPKCDWERTIANEAKLAIEKRFPVGSWVYIENLDEGSFSGRIIADIKQRYANDRWRTVTKVLLEEKEGRWGVPYIRGEDFDWCQILPND